MRYLIMRCVVLLAVFSLLLVPVSAATLRASLAELPGYVEKVDGEYQGVLIDFVHAIGEVADMDVDIQIIPLKRSTYYAKVRKVDFHLPFIRPENIREDTLPYDFSTETVFHLNFVLYSNKSKNLNIDNLKFYHIETDPVFTRYFPFDIFPYGSVNDALKKIIFNEIDGMIFIDGVVDPIVKQLNLKNIHRQLYKRYEVKFVLPRGEKGGDIDQLLSVALRKLKDTGKFQDILGAADSPYNDWQTSD